MSFLGYILSVGQVKTDPANVKAVMEWPTPTSCKHLQWFLSFANFYRRFIWNYSQVVTPLTRLTSTKLPFTWSHEADTVFTRLKDLFTTAPILIHPDTSKSFIAEVDASDIGVGAVLSQRLGSPYKLQTSTIRLFFLSPFTNRKELQRGGQGASCC